MEFEEIKEKIKRDTWWSEECPGRWGYCYWIKSAVEQGKMFSPGLLSIGFIVFKNQFLYEKTSEQEKLAQYKWLKERLKKDSKYLEQEHEKWIKIRNQLNLLIDDIVANSQRWDKDKVAEKYNELERSAIFSVYWGFFLECVDVFSQQELPKKMAKEMPGVDVVTQNDLMLRMCAPASISFMEQIQIEKAELVMMFRKQLDKPNKRLEMAIEGFQNKWKYLSGNYFGDAPMDNTAILNLIKDEAKDPDQELKKQIAGIIAKPDRVRQDQERIIKEHVFSKDLENDFHTMQYIGAWIDERKSSMMRTTLGIWTILFAVERAYGVPKDQLEWYTVEEMNNLFNKGLSLPAQEIEERKALSVFVVLPQQEGGSKDYIYTGQQAQELADLLNDFGKGVLQGMVASAPQALGKEKIVGTVQVELHANKAKFINGNILVTSMTRPEFMPLMKNSLAIITDEGGVTCHAAIVSRELGKPCIIGTKKATKVLKTGDRVELDLNTGIIKKI